MTQKDLVTIGIPTYNRCSTLSKAIESVVSQTYLNIEIIIGDNASIDETQALCESYASKDSRIRYMRHPENIGACNNFNKLLELASGKFFMWLSDDDWIDSSYIEQCLKILCNDSSYSLVCGKCFLYEDGKLLREDKATNIEIDNPIDRIRAFYHTVATNSCFYGVMYTSYLQKIGGLQNVMGGDWLLIAGVAYLGKIKTLETTSVYRSIGGASSNLASLALSCGLSPIWQKLPHLYILFKVTQEIYKKYYCLNSFNKLLLSTRLGLILFLRFFVCQTLRTGVRKVLFSLRKSKI